MRDHNSNFSAKIFIIVGSKLENDTHCMQFNSHRYETQYTSNDLGKLCVLNSYLCI